MAGTAHTFDVVCYDPATGNIALMALLSYDSQADDPSFNPPGMTQLRVPALGIDGVDAGQITNAFVAAAAAQGVTIQIAPPPVVQSGTGTATVTANALES